MPKQRAVQCLIPQGSSMAASPTVAELLDLYLADYLPCLAPGSQQQYRQVLGEVRTALGAVPLDALTPSRLRAWRDSLKPRLQAGTIRTWMGIFSAPLTMAVDDLEWLTRNPLARVVMPPAPPSRVRFLTDEERAALLTACRQSGNAALSPIVLIALTTGARKNEILSLRWIDLDLQRGLLCLARTKNGMGRAVPLPQVTIETLRAWQTTQPLRGELGWVFPGPQRQGPVAMDNAWTSARRRAGLVDFRFHDLRHTAASYLAMSGTSLRDIGEILGHKSLSVTIKYAHLVEAHTRGVIERMSQQFLGPAGRGGDGGHSQEP